MDQVLHFQGFNSLLLVDTSYLYCLVVITASHQDKWYLLFFFDVRTTQRYFLLSFWLLFLNFRVIKLDILNRSTMIIKPVELNFFLKVIDKPQLYHSIAMTSCQELPSIHVNRLANSPLCNFKLAW